MSAKTRTSLPAVAVLGSGAMASAFASDLARAGARVAIWARRSDAASELARRAGANAEALVELGDALGSAEVALICVADSAIADVAQKAAKALAGARPPVLHTSGYHGDGPLSALASVGCAVGSVHPLLSLPPSISAGAEPKLRGAWFAVTGSDAARGGARRILECLGGRQLSLRADASAKPSYHAACALLANGAVALFDAALEILESAGAEREQASQALSSLLLSTARNLWALGVPGALTGPVARGDVDVVAGHLRELERPSLATGELGSSAMLYRHLTARLLALSDQRRNMDPKARAAIAAQLHERAAGES